MRRRGKQMSLTRGSAGPSMALFIDEDRTSTGRASWHQEALGVEARAERRCCQASFTHLVRWMVMEMTAAGALETEKRFGFGVPKIKEQLVSWSVRRSAAKSRQPAVVNQPRCCLLFSQMATLIYHSLQHHFYYIMPKSRAITIPHFLAGEAHIFTPHY